MAGLEREGIDELTSPTVVIGPVALVLFDLLGVGPCSSLAGGVAREAVEAAVREEGLAPVLRGQELEIEAGVAFKLLGDGLVEIDGYLDGGTLAGDDYARVEIVLIVTQGDFNGVFVGPDFTVDGVGNEVPLLGCVAQTHGTALYGADSVVDDLDTGVLLIVEASGEGVAVHEDIDSLPFEIL